MDAYDLSRLAPFPIVEQRDKLARLAEVNDQAAKLAACVRRLDASAARLALLVAAARRGWRS